MTEQERKYNKAKQDIFQMLKSFNELTGQQKELLMKEVVGAEALAQFLNILNAMKYR